MKIVAPLRVEAEAEVVFRSDHARVVEMDSAIV